MEKEQQTRMAKRQVGLQNRAYARLDGGTREQRNISKTNNSQVMSEKEKGNPTKTVIQAPQHQNNPETAKENKHITTRL